MSQFVAASRGSRRPSKREIATLVAERHGLTLEALCGPSRVRRIARARQEAMWLMYAVPGRRTGSVGHWHSLPQIGAFLGERDHTTALHGVRAYQCRLNEACAQAAQRIAAE